jgi:hypothetical protein
MSTPPGQYDSLDALDAATIPAAPPLAETPAPFASQTQPPAITFGATGGPSVAMEGFWITPDDSLQIRVWNSNVNLTSVTVQVRILRPDGSLDTQQFTINNVTSNRVVNQQAFTQLEGFIVAAVIGPPGVAVARGQTFVNLAVVRGSVTNPLMMLVLLSDYLTSAVQPSWPFGRVVSAVEGAGYSYAPSGAVPGAGQDTQIIVPPSTRWQVLSGHTHLVTSAAAGNRQVALFVFQGGAVSWNVAAPATQPPSAGYDYTWAPGCPYGATIATVQTAPLGDPTIVGAGSNITTQTQGIAAGDQYTALTLSVVEWIDV